MAAVNKQHREETSVNAPTRDGWRRIRRNARKKGISEAEAYNQWLNRKGRKTSSAYDFEYFPDTRPPRTKASPTAEELAQEAADEPLRALASSRQLSLHRQFNGLYYFINRGSGSVTLVRNPVNAATFDFTREEVIRFLSGTLQPLSPTPSGTLQRSAVSPSARRNDPQGDTRARQDCARPASVACARHAHSAVTAAGLIPVPRNAARPRRSRAPPMPVCRWACPMSRSSPARGCRAVRLR